MKHKKSDRIAHVFSRVPNIRSYVEDFFWKLPSTMIGLEIEMEGTLNPISELGSNYTILWEQKEDSSLRVVDEYNPFEIIFKVPLSGKDLSEAINQYEIGLQKLKTPPVWGERTSIHVHLDVRECTLKQLFNILVYYTIFEAPLFKFAGPLRSTNIFCLPFASAEGRIFEGLSEGNLYYDDHLSKLTSESLRYSALSLYSLKKYGSLEFRHLAGTSDVQKIRTWINIIMCLKKIDLTNSIKEIPTHFSENGILKVTEEIFGELTPALLYPEFNMDVLRGIRHSQDLLYSDNFKGIPPSQDLVALPEALEKFIESKKLLVASDIPYSYVEPQQGIAIAKVAPGLDSIEIVPNWGPAEDIVVLPDLITFKIIKEKAILHLVGEV